MLRSAKTIIGYHLQAQNGKIGTCSDFLFDEEYWSVRYMVADTGGWLSGKKVLVSPQLFGDPSWASRTFPVLLTKEEIEKAPSLDTHEPVSRRYEKMWLNHFGFKYYWITSGGLAPGYVISSPYQPTSKSDAADTAPEKKSPDNQQVENDTADDDEIRLRSVNEIVGYRINARGELFGEVEEFIVDDTTWIIRYVVMNTGGWFSGKKVLAPPEWIESISWHDRDVVMNVVRSSIEACPEYEPSRPINREYEQVLYDYHGKPHHWE